MSSDKPVLFFEADRYVSEESLERIRNEIRTGLSDHYTCIVLHDGLRLVNQQEFRPKTIHVAVGDIQITGDATSTSTRGTVVIDGVEMKHVRRVVVELAHDEAPTVKLELLAT